MFMKQFLSKMIFGFCILLLSGGIHAQTISTKTAAAPLPTAQNVLAWAQELSPQLQAIIGKVQKIKPVSKADLRTRNSMLKAEQFAKEITSKGSRLSEAEAKKYDTWFRLALSESLEDCLSSSPGSECCFASQYHGQGWGSMWYRANCFVARFPGIN